MPLAGVGRHRQPGSQPAMRRPPVARVDVGKVDRLAGSRRRATAPAARWLHRCCATEWPPGPNSLDAIDSTVIASAKLPIADLPTAFLNRSQYPQADVA